MAEQSWPEASTFAELTTEHYGLLIEWQPPQHGDGFLPPRKQAVCDELRRWIYNGTRRVEVTDMTPRDGFIGRAWHLDADTPVVILRRFRKARKRPWSKLALKPGDRWSVLEEGQVVR